MNPYFFSLEMIVRERFIWCDDDECRACDGMSQTLYNLSREENR